MDLYIMRVLKVDGQVIGTGYTGQRLSRDLLSDRVKLVKHLRSRSLIPKGVRPLLVECQGETCLQYSGEIQLVFRVN